VVGVRQACLCCPDARSAQEAIVLFGYGTETLPVAFGDPGNK